MTTTIKQTQPIGIFDSGIGGLTVARAITKLLPNEQIIYFGDTAHMPYGEKSAEAIKNYSVKIAEFLKSHPRVDKIYWPGFTDHPNYEIAKKQMKDFGGMISFTLKNATLNDTFKLASSFKVFSLAESLGGVESLINHPATMTHASIPKQARERAGVVDSLLGISVGIEDAEDLLEDLRQALETK